MPGTGNQDGVEVASEELGDVEEDLRGRRGANGPRDDVVEDLRTRTVTARSRREEGSPQRTEKVGNVQSGGRDVALTGVARAEAVVGSVTWIIETPGLVDGTTIG